MTSPPGGRLGFGFTFDTSRTRPKAVAPEQETVSVLILADFSGRSNRGMIEPLSGRKRLSINVDNQESIFANLNAALELHPAGGGEEKVTVGFGALEDFHPDHLLQRLEPLAALFETLKALRDPARVTEAAERLQSLLSAGAPPAVSEARTPPQTPQVSEPPPESNQDTLTRLLGKAGPEVSTAKKQESASPVEKLIRQAVESSKAATPAAPSGVEGLVAAADMELSTRLRDLLHKRDFQALETAWRGADFLLRRCPDEERIRFSILDVTLEELSADIEGLRRLLRDAPPDLILGDYSFGKTKADLEALGGLAELCSGLGARFLGGAHPLLAGCDGFDRHPDPEDWHRSPPADVAETWAALRVSSHADRVGLALPRFLLRQPYGQGSDPIEGFGFEEITEAGDHEAFLWGNSAFACAQVLTEAVVREAGGIASGESGEVDELPVFRYKEDGESAMKPCAEAWLSERAAESLLRQGLIPVLSIKGRDAVRVARCVSIVKRA